VTLKTIRSVSIRSAAGSAAALLLTGIAFRLHFNLSSATSLHLFLIAAIALRWGLLEASLVSLLSVACLDYFFTDPLFAFYISDSHDWVALATFEAAALLVSSLSNQATRHGRESMLHQMQLQKLYELSQQILLLDREDAIEQRLADLIRSTLQVEGVALWNSYSQRISRSGACPLSDAEILAIVPSISSPRANHPNTSNTADRHDQPSRRIMYLGTRTIGSLVLCGHTLNTATVNAASSLAAVAIERARSFTIEAATEASRQAEQLRSAILDGLAHAFKSPLTTILASSSGLLAMDTLPHKERRLVSLIDRHAGHLSDLTTHLLLTAKLDSGELKLRREQLDLRELVQEVAENSSLELDGHRIDLCLNSPSPLVRADQKMLQMALLQLLDNAVKYGLPGSPVLIEVREAETELLMSVTNEGSFLAAEEREKVFQRFYRCPDSAGSISGTGIGLSVVKRIVEAHQGRAWVDSDRIHGTTFTMALPRIAEKMATPLAKGR
jgi:two-component system sensor histidine kinase KdpD